MINQSKIKTIRLQNNIDNRNIVHAVLRLLAIIINSFGLIKISTESCLLFKIVIAKINLVCIFHTFLCIRLTLCEYTK